MAATSARSWVRVRGSSGPCRARAAAVVRSQIPAAVSAGRYAENQAIPSESGRNSTRRSLALLVWRFSMLSGWWRSRHVRTFERNRYGTRSPAGQPRAGFGASGSRKCASSAAAPAGSRLAVSSTMARACAQEIVPACKAFRVSGKRFVRARQSPRNAPAVPAPTVRTQATSAVTAISWHFASCSGHRRCSHGVGGPHIGRGHQHLQRSKPRLHPDHAGQAVQALIRQIPQRIIPQRAGPGRTSPAQNRTDQSVIRTGQIGAVRSSAVGAAPGERNPAPPSTPQQPPAPPCPPHSSPCFPYPHQIRRLRQLSGAQIGWLPQLAAHRYSAPVTASAAAKPGGKPNATVSRSTRMVPSRCSA